MAMANALRMGAKFGLGMTGASSVATFYVYKTDESYKRLIDFHILFTPMCWDYYKHLKSKSESKEKQAQELERLHQKYAPEALGHILNLGGYYVKCAQMFCGMNLLPDVYEEEFSILLDQVPAKPFEVVEKIVLDELGGNSVLDHFKSFDETPIAAASIGQVHCAELYNGEKVVVKVQYPEVERFFRMDVLGMKNLCDLCCRSGIDIGIDQKSLDDIFNEFTKSFEEEFDYRREAANMQLIKDNMSAVPEFKAQVRVPKPIEDKTTKKVLTMERLQGEPIKQHMKRMMEEWASKEGKSPEEFEKGLKKKLEDPVELQKLLSQKPPSQFQLRVYRALMRTTDLLTNVQIWIRNAFRETKNKQPYQWSTLPLEGSRIAALLYNVHAHQVFVDGAFNADPHAGNVLICDEEDSDSILPTLGLVDFGNVQRIPDKARRVALAKFYLTMAKDYSDNTDTWNDIEIAKAFAAVGGESVKMDTTFLALNALLMYDIRYDVATLTRYHIKPDMSNIMEVYSKDDFKEFPSDLVNLQRLSQTLVGVAGIIGAGQPSCARMWQHQCEDLLKMAEDP